MRSRIVVVAAVSAACGSKAPPVAPPTAPPSAPAAAAPSPPLGAPPSLGRDRPASPPDPNAPLPTWDDVESGHPVGATNPPAPVLVVTPDHRCYKRWQSGMVRQPGLDVHDHVEPTLVAPATEVQCPEPRATDALNAWRAGQPP